MSARKTHLSDVKGPQLPTALNDPMGTQWSFWALLRASPAARTSALKAGVHCVTGIAVGGREERDLTGPVVVSSGPTVEVPNCLYGERYRCRYCDLEGAIYGFLRELPEPSLDPRAQGVLSALAVLTDGLVKLIHIL